MTTTIFCGHCCQEIPFLEYAENHSEPHESQPIAKLTPMESDRLEQIRANAEKWRKTTPESYYWEAPFMLRIIDRLLAGDR